MKKLVIATFNEHKVKEYMAMLPKLELDYCCLKDYPNACPPEENGKTLEENAIIKAKYAAKITGQWALGDDTGLEVMALGGAPGIFSARYAGKEHDYEANNNLLLKNMQNFHGDSRAARFVCVIALASPLGKVDIVKGILNGLILESPRGRGGFGYDSLFQVCGSNLSLAELSPNTKNSISHRRMALDKIAPLLQKISV